MPIPESTLKLDYGRFVPVFRTKIIEDKEKNVLILLEKRCKFRWKIVGSLNLLYTYDLYSGKWFWETHSFIYSEFQNRGYGSYLYSIAADFAFYRGTKLMSSVKPSNAAKRLWKSNRLCQHYNVCKHNKRWTITPKESIELNKVS